LASYLQGRILLQQASCRKHRQSLSLLVF
jgi:hypothetical protein